MPGLDVRTYLRSAWPTGALGILAIVLGAVVSGGKGALGGLLAALVVIAFFSLSFVVVRAAAKVSPQAMMAAEMGTYIVKILLLGVLVVNVSGTDAFDTKVFGFTVLACALCWTGTQVWTGLKSRVPYVEPNAE